MISDGDPNTYDLDEELSAGTYYMKISKIYSGSRYRVKLTEKIMASSIEISGKKKVVVGEEITLSAEVSPSNATDKTIKWSSGNSSIASVNSSTGVVTAKKVGNVKIYAEAQDGSGVVKAYKIIVKPKKSEITSLYMTSSSSKGKGLHVGFSTQSGVSGYQIQFANNKKFKNAKSKKFSTSYGYINYYKKLSKKCYVRVRAYYKTGGKTYYGKWSNTKKIKTR